MKLDDKIQSYIKILYPHQHVKVLNDLEIIINKWIKIGKVLQKGVTEEDSILITYGDSIYESGVKTLRTLIKFLDWYVKDVISTIHILPMFPYTSDDGFSVVNYLEINEMLGSWDDIHAIGKNYNLMFDAVINHISKESNWFKEWSKGNPKYQNYFIECDENLDYSQVVRPRNSPLFYQYPHVDGKKLLWATFSEDQIDLNFKDPQLMLDILDVLLFYVQNGAKFIRLDAVGFIWKTLGTSCIHLENTHLLIKLYKRIIDIIYPGVSLITETNVPHLENISYFGNGFDEAQLVYQFPLPPLTLFSFFKEDSTKLTDWMISLNESPLTDETSYFNFLASHDGIGLRPVEGILTEDEKQFMIDKVILQGGRVSYKGGVKQEEGVYELNINYQDALSSLEERDDIRIKRFIASQVLLLSVQGVPGIYIHSLLGSRNDINGLLESNINRRINRKKFELNELENLIQNEPQSVIFKQYLKLIQLRKAIAAFHPNAKQFPFMIDKRLISFIRENIVKQEKVLVLINLSTEEISINDYSGKDLITGEDFINTIYISPLGYRWILLSKGETA